MLKFQVVANAFDRAVRQCTLFLDVLFVGRQGVQRASDFFIQLRDPFRRLECSGTFSSFARQFRGQPDNVLL
jgi:hypothetical protein